MTLDELLKRVENRDTFLEFVAALAADRADEVAKEKARPSNPYGQGANGWENGTIEAFLDAALRWAEDSGPLPIEPSWQAFATFLYCGKLYE
jgi:hypothetical protein